MVNVCTKQKLQSTISLVTLSQVR